MSMLSLKDVVNNYGGRAAVVFSDTHKLSVKNDLFGGKIVWQASLKRRLAEMADVLWGVADLHAHPAANYAFGAESDGWGGVIWGHPGGSHATTNHRQDLPRCDKNIHLSRGIVGPVRKIVRSILLEQLESEGPPRHGPYGFPSFASWPSALSRTHQQMHITWIRRAWSGGLRLMVASTVDSQVIHEMWHASCLDLATKIGGVPALQLDRFQPNPDFDFFSALKQLNAIRALVEANRSWMEIVTTPDGARRAIKNDKLAVVLGVEMDQLTADQIIVLKQSAGVRLATPIHLVNNGFGGAAIYSDNFNSANFALNGSFFQVDHDKSIGFRLDPLQLGVVKVFGIPVPVPLDYIPDYGRAGLGGHKNTMGLESEGDLKKLMKAGLLIDVHHMSEECIDGAISLAKPFRYPLLKTHTGLRPETRPRSREDNENSVKPSHARAIMELGGMIGLGTGKKDVDEPVHDWLDQYSELMEMKGAVPVGLGTDMNGLDIHFDFAESEVDIDYPLKNPCPNIGKHPQQQDIHPMASMPGISDFRAKGLAHYGLIPEFLHAVDELDQNGPHIHSLFSSAHAFVKTWERVEEAQGRVV